MKKLILLCLILCLVLMCGCSGGSTGNYNDDWQDQTEEYENSEQQDEYILADDSVKKTVNDALRGYYFTFNLGDGVEAEYSFNDGVAAVTTFLNGNQFGATQSGYYEVYEKVIISNFGGGDVTIGYNFVNGEIELTYLNG